MKPRALIVDDEQPMQKIFTSILGREGFSVDCLSDILTAEACLSVSEYDVIFVDIFIGRDSGIDLLRRIFTFDPNAQVVLMTGQPSINSAAEATRLGAIDYVTKPINVPQIISISLRALRNRQLIKENALQRQNMEAIFRSVSEAIVLVDNEGRLLQFNETATKLCGYDQNQLNSSILAVDSGCGGNCRLILEEVLKNRCQRHLQRVECKKSGSTKRFISITVSPVIDGKGFLSGAVSVIRDESELVFLENQLSRQSGFSSIIGKSAAMQRLYSLVDALADVQTTVLINGESGVGKELIAAALHRQGVRRDCAYVKVNCSALSEHLLESELFGHVRGAFTGAVENKVGRFQKAHGGTILLDEIGDISPAIQMRLLRVLQEQEFEQVGDSTPIKVDVRVIAATNQDLAEKVRLGSFRADLFYRLNVVRLIIPPLRERKDDIPLLVSHFLDKFNRKFCKQLKAVVQDVMELFMRHSWPGNIRELEHVIEHAALLSTSSFLSHESLPQDFLNAVSSQTTENTSQPNHSHAMNLDEALRVAGGNKAKAARLLGISRSTLYVKLND